MQTTKIYFLKTSRPNDKRVESESKKRYVSYIMKRKVDLKKRKANEIKTKINEKKTFFRKWENEQKEIIPVVSDI